MMEADYYLEAYREATPRAAKLHKCSECHGPILALHSRDEWYQWLQQSGPVVWPNDWYEYGEIGMTVDRRCMAHLFGLQLAYNQLEGRALPAWMMASV